MTDTDIASSGRRGFITAALGTALAASLDARAAPLLGVPGTARLAAANAWLEIDLDVFDANLRRVRALAGDAQLCAVLKADAYGTGIDRVIPRLVAAGVGCVGIASTEEARMVRACGYRGRVLRVRAATLGEVETAWPWRRRWPRWHGAAGARCRCTWR